MADQMNHGILQNSSIRSESKLVRGKRNEGSQDAYIIQKGK
jgi:hypothetical protein